MYPPNYPQAGNYAPAQTAVSPGYLGATAVEPKESPLSQALGGICYNIAELEQEIATLASRLAPISRNAVPTGQNAQPATPNVSHGAVCDNLTASAERLSVLRMVVRSIAERLAV